ncbi:hypothetical protein [Bacillus sp. ISL-7]|uniref:hypothetical protein n=1 Tax=Bacillus sp. ISL-7 TaxID=2819136 RepID=UPI001BE4FFEC|nr:hypothetical protein [Bacillus sp. ISL-7]MBT2735131.1 hypothetical protein [Bacillus sp. ISL-7]
MGTPTPNLLLKQWQATDTKLQTWTDYNETLNILDTEITTIKAYEQNVLWTGASYPSGAPAAPVVPTKKLSECRNGWIICWSDYNPGEGSNDYDFVTNVIPKWYGAAMNGKSHLFTIPIGLSSTEYTITNKRLYIYDDKIVGHDDNSAATIIANDAVIRAILEW